MATTPPARVLRIDDVHEAAPRALPLSRAPQDRRAEADHETLTALHQMSKQQLELLEGQHEILELLRTKVG